MNKAKKKMFYSRKVDFIESKNKRVLLTQKDIFKTLRPLNLPEYKGEQLFYQDIVINITRMQIRKRYRLTWEQTDISTHEISKKFDKKWKKQFFMNL